MTCIEEILSRALLVRDRTVPRDIVAPITPGTTHPRSIADQPERDRTPNEAAEDLRALCETLVTHTPATIVAEFVTDQVREPRSALVLACVLQLTDTDDGARFWWQYAAGAGQGAAAYCLYLHHLALGESDTADWWHRQTDDCQPLPRAWHPAGHQLTSTSTTTILRILRHLAKKTVQPRSATVAELMGYVPTAVSVGYLREPEMDLPMPGPDFADRISTLLAAAANRPDVPSALPTRPGTHERTPGDTNRLTTRPSCPQRNETGTPTDGKDRTTVTPAHEPHPAGTVRTA